MVDNEPLVSTEWLAGQLGRPDLRVLDASWYLPAAGRAPATEWAEGHIPTAQFFDIEQVVDQDSELPHTAPGAEVFAAYMRAMGVGSGDRVVIYDSAGIFSAPRVWWLFRLFGHKQVAVLDGGLKRWRAEGRALAAGEEPVAAVSDFSAQRNAAWVREVEAVARASRSGDAQIVDARSAGRFRGEEAEPRAGLRAGHIPAARNVHYQDLLREDGRMKDPAALRTILSARGIDLQAPIISSCGSGITAAIINLALERLGHTEHALYDGSWAEWGSTARPVE